MMYPTGLNLALANLKNYLIIYEISFELAAMAVTEHKKIIRGIFS